MMVLACDLKGGCLGACEQIVEREYAELFPGEVEAVHVVHDTAAINSAVKEYGKLKGKLEDLLDDYVSKKRRHMKIKRKKARAPPLLREHATRD